MTSPGSMRRYESAQAAALRPVPVQGGESARVPRHAALATWQ
ncbi:hypothetical protein [Actinacidiphila soli]|nr:hypothetical protein [Actinacidiphila soli]